MQSTAIRQGQREIGIVTHEGKQFAAMGSSVHGSNVTGYLTGRRRGLALTRWGGSTMLDCRARIVKTYHLEDGKTYAVVFALTHGRYIVGYATGYGMPFRGKLVDAEDAEDAAVYARNESERLIEIDAEDTGFIEIDADD